MKKIYKWAGSVLLLVVIVLFVLLLNWESLSYYALKNVAQFYTDRSHITLKLGVIDGNPFSQTKIENISIRPENGQPQAYHFKAQAISCTYNLWDLKEGYELFLQGLNCTADTPEFVYDLSAALPQEQSSDEPAQFFVPVVLPALDLHNGTVILTHSDWNADFRGINSILRSAASDHELQLEVASFRFNHEGAARIDTGFVSLLRYAEDKLTIDSLKLGEEQISATGFIDLALMDKGYFKFETEVELRESQLLLQGSFTNWLLQINAGTENFDIGELQKRLGGTGWDIAGKIKAEADLAINLATLEDLKGTFAVDVQEGKLHGDDIDSVSLIGNFDNAMLNISSAEASTPGNHVLVKDLSVPMPLLRSGEALSILEGSQGVFAADMTDFATLLQLSNVEDDVLPEVVRPNAFTINGTLKNGIIHLNDGRAVTADTSLTINRATIPIPSTKEAYESVEIDLGARIESSNLEGLVELFGDIPLKGQASADVSITGRVKAPKFKINLSGEQLFFNELQLGRLSLQGYAKLVQQTLGTIKTIEFELTEMEQDNGSGVLALLSPIAGTWQDDRFTLNGVLQLDGKGEIATNVSRLPGKEIAVAISIQNLDSDGWLGNFIDNSFFFHGADIEAVLKGLPYNTEVELIGTISEAGGTGVPLPLSGSFALQYSPKGIDVKKFTWRSHERSQLTITGFLPYDPMAAAPFVDEELSLKGHIDFPSLEDIAVFLEPWGIGKGSVVLDMDVSGTWDQPEGHIHFQAEGLEPPDTMRQYMGSAVNFSGDIAALGGAVVLQQANLESAQYTGEAKGSWRHGISVRELLPKGKGELTGMVSADASIQFKDLNFLRQKLTWLRRLEGDLQGKVHLDGSITAPRITGSFSMRDGEVNHTFNFPMLSAVNLQGKFDENSITIENMQAEVGGSPVNLNGIIKSANEVFDLSLHVDGKNLLLFRNNDMRLRGDVQLDISGPLEKLIVQGTTGLTGGYYTRNIDFLGMLGSSSAPVSEGVGFLFSFPDPPLKDAVLDIRITTIEPFRIRNNLIRGVLRPELSLRGTGELPYLIGTVYIDPSRVLLPSGRLQVQSGLLRFLEGEPDRPQLDLLAQSKILGYDINVVTQGPIDDPVITLSSSPSLPNDELLLLLLTGQPPKEDAAGGAKSSGTTNVMVYLGRDFLNKWLEDESGASDESILDRFELDFGRNITKSGEQTVESTFRLSEYTTGKGKMYYLTGEKDKYDAYNYGLRLVFRFE